MPIAAKLAVLRDAIAGVDRALLELLRRRMELAAEVGRVKANAGKPIVVPEVYDQVLTRARAHAEICGVSDSVMASIFDAVIRGSVERQHRVGIELRRTEGSRMLILGGAGSMGFWFGRFAQLVGHPVDIVDPAIASLPESEGRYSTLEEVEDLDAYEAVVVSVPLTLTSPTLEKIIERRPSGLVIEIASIKDHLKATLEKATAAGVRVASLHPMFGPKKSHYEGLTFVLAYRADLQEERRWVDGWLRHPYTHLVPVPFDHHDRLMGWLLGLAHLLGMLFGSALTHSGLGADELKACASTSFNRQAAAALHVLAEDPDLYYEIQQLNPHRREVYHAARTALGELVDAVQDDDREAFREVLTAARQFLDTGHP